MILKPSLICSGECFPIQVSTEQNSHVGMPHRLLNVCLSMKVSNELSRFAKHFCAIFLANQLLVGLAHYDPKAFINLLDRLRMTSNCTTFKYLQRIYCKQTFHYGGYIMVIICARHGNICMIFSYQEAFLVAISLLCS